MSMRCKSDRHSRRYSRPQAARLRHSTAGRWVAGAQRVAGTLDRVRATGATEGIGGSGVKAKEYAATYRAKVAEAGGDDRQALWWLVTTLSSEAEQITRTRTHGKPHDAPLVRALREIDAKWRSIAYDVGLNPNGFRAFWADKGVTW